MKTKAFLILLLVIIIDICNMGCKSRRCDVIYTQTHIKASFNPNDSTSGSYNKDSILIVKFDSLLLNITLIEQAINCTKATNNVLIQKAYATSISHFYTLKDTLQAFNIYTLRNYNAQYPAGSTINPMVLSRIYSSGNNKTTDEVVEYFQSRKSYSDRYLRNSEYFSSTLNQKPTNSGDTVQLAIDFRFNNGKTLRDTTDKFVIIY